MYQMIYVVLCQQRDALISAEQHDIAKHVQDAIDLLVSRMGD